MAIRKTRNYLAFRPCFEVGDLMRLVAERDGALAQYYVGHDRFLARALSRDDPASVFIGPKGVGKSAILQMIRLQQDSAGNRDRVIEVAPDDLAFNALVNIKARTPLLQEPGQNQWLFKSLWDYVLTVAILEKEVRDRHALEALLIKCFGGRDRKEEQQLLRITLTDDGSPKKSMTDQMLSLVEQIQLQGAYGDVSVAAEIGVRDKAPARGDLKLLQLINNVAKQLPTSVKHEYFVLIDDLDLHWQGTALQNAFLGTLFYSMRKLSVAKNIKFVVSLRKEIFRQVELEERDKFADLVCEVTWSKSAVREMVERRLEYVLTLTQCDLWNAAFPENAYDEMWEATNGMPREVIRLAVECVLVAQEEGQPAISQSHISEARRRFSEGRLDDLSSIQQYKWPELRTVLSLFAGGPKEFDAEYIREVSFRAADRASGDRASRYGWAGAGIDDPLTLARTLLEIGFLLVKDGRDAKARIPTDEEIRLIEDRHWYAIHPMYVSGLGLRGT